MCYLSIIRNVQRFVYFFYGFINIMFFSNIFLCCFFFAFFFIILYVTKSETFKSKSSNAIETARMSWTGSCCQIGQSKTRHPVGPAANCRQTVDCYCRCRCQQYHYPSHCRSQLIDRALEQVVANTRAAIKQIHPCGLPCGTPNSHEWNSVERNWIEKRIFI